MISTYLAKIVNSRRTGSAFRPGFPAQRRHGTRENSYKAYPCASGATISGGEKRQLMAIMDLTPQSDSQTMRRQVSAGLVRHEVGHHTLRAGYRASYFICTVALAKTFLARSYVGRTRL